MIADRNVFLEFIFPSLKSMSTDPSELVRSAYADCIYSLGIFCFLNYLAEISARFLDLSQIFRDLVPPDSDEDEILQVSFLYKHKDANI